MTSARRISGFQDYSSKSQQLLIGPYSPNVALQLQRSSSCQSNRDRDRNGMVEGLGSYSSSFYRMKESFRCGGGGGIHPGPSPRSILKQNDQLPAQPSREIKEDGTITVDIDRALETLSVEQAREILAKLEHDVKEKQIELQTMVMEKYPELIESANMIVSMKDKAEKVVQQLESFPAKLDELIRDGEKLDGMIAIQCTPEEKYSTITVPPSTSMTTRKSISREDVMQDTTTDSMKLSTEEDVVRLMLHAPSAIWSALDEGRLLIAARIYLKCLQAMSNSSHLENFQSVDCVFVRSQWSYACQFPEKIFAQAKVMLFAQSKQQQELEYEKRTSQTCEALAATVVVAGITLLSSPHSSLSGSSVGEKEKEIAAKVKPEHCIGEAALTPSVVCRSLNGIGRGALVLLLKQRTAMLAAAMRECTTIDLVEGLEHVLWLLHSTVLDMYAAFANASDGICKLITQCCEGISIASPLLNESEALSPTSAEQKDSVTEWLGVVLKKMRSRLRKVLKSVSNAEHLVNVRNSMWNIMQQHAVDERWRVVCSTLVDVSALPPSLGLFSVPGSKWRNAELDLWLVLFSGTFSNLAEDVLRRSFDAAIERVLETLEWALRAGGRSPARTAKSKRKDFHNELVFPLLYLPALPAHEAVYFATMVISRLNESLKALHDDAESLVQQGDIEGGSRLLTSLRVQSASLVIRLLNRLRVIVEDILGTETGPSQSDVDMASIIGRVVWLLSGKGGDETKAALSLMPRNKDERKTGVSVVDVQLSQIEAAFAIACTAGNEVLNGVELIEALEAIGLATPECNSPPLPCSTYAEFCFLCIPACEVMNLEDHFHEALKLIAAKSTKIWERYYLEPACRAAIDACESISLACRTRGMVNSLWKEQHGTWEKVSLGREEGDELGEDNIWVPTSVTPPVKRFVESVSMALSTLISTADLGAANSEEMGGGLSHFSASCPVSQVCGVALDRTVSVLSTFYSKMCCGAHAPTVSAPESARIQILTDIEWLKLWVPDPVHWFGKAEQDLEALFDPIDLQTYRPFIQSTAQKGVTSCQLFLERLTRIPVLPRASLAPSTTSQLDYASSNVNIMPLVKKSARFDLLPLAATAGKIISSDKTKRFEQQRQQQQQNNDAGGARYNTGWFGEKEEQGVAALAGLVRGTVSSFWQSSRTS